MLVVSGGVSGSRNGRQSLKRGLRVSSEMRELIAAMQAQTKAINNLVESNQQVIALLTDVVSSMVDEGDGEPVSLNYLDGSPRG